MVNKAERRVRPSPIEGESLAKEDIVSLHEPFDTPLPDSPPLSSPAQDLVFPTHLFEQEGSNCSTIRHPPPANKVEQSDTATEDYTLLTSRSRGSAADDTIDPYSFSPRSIDKTTIEMHINKAKETSRAYQILLKQKDISHRAESWKLFRLLYSFWRETGQVRIPSHHLSTLLKSDSDTEPIDFLLVSSSNSSSHVVDDAIQRCFPIQWTDSRYYVDFTSMIEAVTSTSSASSSLPHLLKRRPSTLLG